MVERAQMVETWGGDVGTTPPLLPTHTMPSWHEVMSDGPYAVQSRSLARKIRALGHRLYARSGGGLRWRVDLSDGSSQRFNHLADLSRWVRARQRERAS